jgi:hypothetical protein
VIRSPFSAGKRLVIEYVSFRSNILTGETRSSPSASATRAAAPSARSASSPDDDRQRRRHHHRLHRPRSLRASAIPYKRVDPGDPELQRGSDTVNYTITGFFVNVP